MPLCIHMSAFLHLQPAASSLFEMFPYQHYLQSTASFQFNRELDFCSPQYLGISPLCTLSVFLPALQDVSAILAVPPYFISGRFGL